MKEVGLFEAWHQWWLIGEVKDLQLYGMSILWWGRIGKIVQFFSALAIVVEIVGPKPFHNVAEAFHRRSVFAIPLQIWGLSESPRFTLPDSLRKVLKIGFAVLIALAVGYFTTDYISTRFSLGIVLKVIFFMVIAGFTFVTIWMWLSLVATANFLLFNFAVVPLVDLIFDSPNLLWWVKVFSVLLLLLGFHFDLLAS